MRFSRRTRIVVGVFFFTAVGLLWFVQWSESPRWAFWGLIALSAALASFEALVRKVLIPRGVSERHSFVLELVFAAVVTLAVTWFSVQVYPGR